VPPRKSPTLTEAELRLMEILWEKGPSTVHQLLEALPGRPALAYNSVLTTIRVLEKKAYVQHLKDGRAHVYQPLVGREEASRSEVRNLLGRFFKNSHELLMLNLIQNQGLDGEELKRLRELLEPGRREGAPKP
jgi:BlaI family transcriptional regulator, penicillinase repressor